MHRTCPIRLAVALVMLALPLVLLGCAGPGRLTLTSLDQGNALSPTLRTAVYRYSDRNTADVYLSDVAPEVLANREIDLGSLEGQITHIGLFLRPYPGRTPIQPDACNVTFRHLVLAGDSAGLYGGGGFVLPRGATGDRVLSGKVLDATLRLLKARSFEDRLGTTDVSGRFNAQLDPALAELIAARLDATIDRLSTTD